MDDLGALVLLAVVQGLTEFLPISSSGHLVLSQELLGLEQGGVAIEVALHLGTLVAVLAVYRADVARLIAGAFRGSGLREVLLLVVGTLPAAVVGLLFKDALEELFTPRVAGFGLLATAAILVGGEVARRRGAPGRHAAGPGDRERGPGPGQALLIGCAQALAILPGISRSGSTIAMGLACGLSPADSARFSFLLAIPAILGAAVLALPELERDGSGTGALLTAVAVAALVGFGALKLLLAFLGRGVFVGFALYCALVGTVALFVLG